MNTNAAQRTGYELSFRSLFDEGRGSAFACDASGRVDLDTLSQQARLNYLSASALIGRDFASPVVQSRRLH